MYRVLPIGTCEILSVSRRHFEWQRSQGIFYLIEEDTVAIIEL